MNSEMGQPAAPAGLTASAAGNGVIRITFADIDSGDPDYEIWRRHGDTVDWYLHATTRDTAFDDEGVTPGQYYEYKIRAVRGDVSSEFSESKVVYGV